MFGQWIMLKLFIQHIIIRRKINEWVYDVPTDQQFVARAAVSI